MIIVFLSDVECSMCTVPPKTSLVEMFPDTHQVTGLTPLSPGHRQKCCFVTVKDPRSHFNTLLMNVEIIDGASLRIKSCLMGFHRPSHGHALLIFLLKEIKIPVAQQHRV